LAEVPLQSALWTLGLGWFVMVGTIGCQASSPLESMGLALAVPGSWRPVEPDRWMVPGKALAAWSGPEGSSLVIYRTLPNPGGTATAIAEGLANRLTNLPELTLLAKRTENLAGQPAARVEVVAPGSGAMLAKSGLGSIVAPEDKPLVPTRQVTIGFARRRGTLFLSWHLPEQAYSRIAPDIESVLKSLTLAPDTASPSSTY
jgi:hypothetical protein